MGNLSRVKPQVRRYLENLLKLVVLGGANFYSFLGTQFGESVGVAGTGPTKG